MKHLYPVLFYFFCCSLLACTDTANNTRYTPLIKAESHTFSNNLDAKSLFISDLLTEQKQVLVEKKHICLSDQPCFNKRKKKKEVSHLNR